MKSSSFSTRTLLDWRDQFDAWRTWFSPVFEISREGDATDFVAENEIWDLGGLAISRVSAPSVRVKRAKANLRRAPVDHWVLSYCRHGSTVIRTKNSDLVAASRVPYLWSLGEESESERTEVDRLQILFPRDTHGDMAGLLDASLGSALKPPWGYLLGEYMALLDEWLPRMKPEELPRLKAAVRSMVAASVAPSVDRIALANGGIRRVILERVRQVVRRHLKSSSLCPSALCTMVGISRSELYRLLEHAGGVSHYIQRQRLLAAYSTLCDPANAQSIQSVSADFCFMDASTFSRAFKREFGQSPSDVRAAAASGTPISAPSRIQPSFRREQFIDAIV
jgi:AraC-like DNA-binding protein